MTTTRAEWHLLEPVVASLNEIDGVDPVVLAGGTHLLASHGMTIGAVEKSAGCEVLRVDFVGLENDSVASHAAMARLTGQAVIAFAQALERVRADVAVVLGDRFETMGAALAAVSLLIPVAHIEGGHVTEGAIDERYRHAISKLADMHFVALPVHARRVEALGERPERIVIAGPIGAALIKNAATLSREEMSSLTGFDSAARPVFIVTVHPETAADSGPDLMLGVLFSALELAIESLSPTPAFILTGSNLDPGGHTINIGLKNFARKYPDSVRMMDSLGNNYHAAVKASAGIIGNSSSGIIETSAIGIPTVNIGVRQKGRDRYGPVIDLPWSARELFAAIEALCANWTAGKRPEATESSEQPWTIIARRIAQMNRDEYLSKPFIELLPE